MSQRLRPAPFFIVFQYYQLLWRTQIFSKFSLKPIYKISKIDNELNVASPTSYARKLTVFDLGWRLALANHVSNPERSRKFNVFQYPTQTNVPQCMAVQPDYLFTKRSIGHKQILFNFWNKQNFK